MSQHRFGASSAALFLAAALGGCASGPNDREKPANKPDPGEVPAGRPNQKPAEPARTPRPAAEHPPDEQPGAGAGQAGKGGLLDELHRDLSLRDKERLGLAEHYFKVGKQAYDQLDYAEAARNFAKAKEADPNDKKIQQYYLMASLLAGDRQAEFKVITERLREERSVSVDQQVLELKRLHDEGQRLLAAKDYDKAVIRFEQVLEKIRWFPYPVSDAGIEKSAREGIIQSKKLKRDREIADRLARERTALDNALNEEHQAQQRKKDVTEKLIRDGMELLDQERYEKAERTFEGVLLRDPNNEKAQKYLEVAQEGRHIAADRQNYDRDHRERAINDTLMREVGNTYIPTGRVFDFPSADHWKEKVERRRQGIATQAKEEPQWIQDYKKKLQTQKLTFNFTATPFSEVVQFLQDFTGLNITVSKAIDQEQVKLDLRLRDVIAQNALDIILNQTGFAISFKNETLMITPKEEAKGEYYLDIYDVQDILAAIPDFPGPRIQIKTRGAGGGGGGGRGGAKGSFQFDDDEQEETGSVIEPDKLEGLVKNSTGADEVWGDPASYELHRGQIIVNQTKEVHDNIRKVLKNLRTNVGLFVQVEARFILVHNDFMQDIGVDYRGLGSSDRGSNPPLPIWGTPISMDPNIPGQEALRRGGDEIGFGQRIVSGNRRNQQLGPVFGGIPFFGSSFLGGRLQNILDGGDAYFSGERLNNSTVSANTPNKGLAFQSTILDPFQVNAIVRAEQERLKEKIVTAPVVVAANRQRVHVSIVTQRAYISDYELSSGGTGLAVAEVASPIIQTLQEGVVLDVRPTISADRKYVTLDLKPTLADLQQLKPIPVNLGTQGQAAINVNIEVPEIKLQECYTSVTVPDGGTALVGGFRQFNEKQQRSGVPFVDNVPLLNVLFKREAEMRETESLVILVTARIVVLRDEEKKRFNAPR